MFPFAAALTKSLALISLPLNLLVKKLIKKHITAPKCAKKKKIFRYA